MREAPMADPSPEWDVNAEAARITKSIAIEADAAVVWRVLVEPALIGQWLSDVALEVTVEPVLGGAMTSRGNWHGIEVENKSTFVAYEPGRTLAYTHWSSLSELPDTPGNYSLVRMELADQTGATALNLRQENLLTPEIFGHWNFFWAVALDRIRRMAETGRL
jgi:uncharacterized protein YndB with AHSA1/START domain